MVLVNDLVHLILEIPKDKEEKVERLCGERLLSKTAALKFVKVFDKKWNSVDRSIIRLKKSTKTGSIARGGGKYSISM